MEVDLTVKIEPTPEELADEVCELYEDAQARFLNRIAAKLQQHPAEFCMQLLYIDRSEVLNKESRRLIEELHQHINKKGE